MFNWPPFSRGNKSGTHQAHTTAAVKRLHAEYRALAMKQLGKLGIPEDCVDLDVGATSQQGRVAYNVKIRVVRWERNMGMRLLVSLPALETRMRKAVAASWLGGVSDFGGVWVHASSRLPGPEVERDSEWAISELQAFETQGEAAADRLRRDMRTAAGSGTRA
jgi:hypothetical protein